MNVLSRRQGAEGDVAEGGAARMARPPPRRPGPPRAHRLAEIDRRLEILGGLLIAYLNLDEVIRIIREEDEPKAVMMADLGS
jgi:hypothetical protein